MTNQERRMLLEKFRSSGMEGSIMDVYQAYGQGVDLVDEHLRAQNQGQPATLTTPEEQQQGLRPYHDAGELNKTAVFKDVPPNTPFNTHGMKAPINIDKYSQEGHLIESHKSVPPGISNIPTGPYEGDVIETPADGYQTGGFVDRKQTGGFKYTPSEALRRSGKVVRKQKGGEHYDVRRAEKRQRQGYDLYDEETKHWSSVDPKTGKFLKGSKHPTIDKEVDWYNSEKGANFKINNRLVTHNIFKKEKKYYKYEPRTLEQEKNKPFKRQLRKALGLNPLNKRQQKKFEGYSKDVSEVNEASSLLDAKAERERMLTRSEVERSQRDHYEILRMIAPGGTVTQEMLNDPAYKDLPDYKRAQEEKYSKNKKQRGGMVENPSMDGFDSIKEREEWRESKLKLMQDKQDAGLEHGARHIWDDDYRFTPPPEDEKDNWVALPSRYPEWKRIKRIPPKKLKSKKISTISEAREPKELQESNVSLYKGPKHPTKRVMRYSNKVRTNQIPSHDMVWNNKKNKYVKRNVEKEEVDRYKKENRFRTPTRIEANFKTGGTKYPSKKK